MEDFRELDAFFQPKTVAVAGAADSLREPGGAVIAHLLRSGFAGKIFPISKDGGFVQGIPALKGPGEIPQPVDLALVSVPSEEIPSVLTGLAGVPARAIVLLGERVNDDALGRYVLDERLVKFLREKNILLLGPLSLGVMHPGIGLDASLAPQSASPGGAAFFSQCPSFCREILDAAEKTGTGFSKWACLGGMDGIDQADLLEYLREDDSTRTILCRLEELRDGAAFTRQAFRAARKKPVIALSAMKGGEAEGPDYACRAAFRQCGAVEAASARELLLFSEAFTRLSLPAGPGLAVLADSDEAAIRAARAVTGSAQRLVRLKDHAAASEEALRAALEDEAAHSVLIFLTRDEIPAVDGMLARIARAKAFGKPVLVSMLDRDGPELESLTLPQSLVPVCSGPVEPIRVLDAMLCYSRFLAAPPSAEVCWLRDIRKASAVFEAARARGAQEAAGRETRDVLLAYGLPMPEGAYVKTSAAATKAANKIGYPVTIRALSSDGGEGEGDGARRELSGEEELRQAFDALAERQGEGGIPDPGFWIQAAPLPGSREVVVGFSRDPRFGPLILFGIGGIYKKSRAGASRRLAPLTLDDAHDMVREALGYEILREDGETPPADEKAIEDIIMIMSQLALDFPEIDAAQFDPVLAGEHGALIADCRFGLCGTKKG